MGTRRIALSRGIVMRTGTSCSTRRRFFPPRAGPRGAPALRANHQVRARRDRRERRAHAPRLHLSPASLNPAAEQRKVKGVIHWASVNLGTRCEVKNFDRLFSTPSPSDVPEGEDYKRNLNPASLETLSGAIAGAVAREREARGALPGRQARLLRGRQGRGALSLDPQPHGRSAQLVGQRADKNH